MKNKEIPFNGDDLVDAVGTFAKHVSGSEKLTLRSRTLKLRPKEITELRARRKPRGLTPP